MKLYALIALIPVALVGCSSNPPAQQTLTKSCDTMAHYDIHFDRFDEVAQQVSHATGCFIETDLSQTGSVKPNPVVGSMSIRQAIKTAIQGTDLMIVSEDNHVIRVKKKPE
ncbi:STN domain-containing protein [Celerinatantimonas sp. YJH-8]|uniref:STN domain-containing protein n=1 Tax=Celerinatantimonas sp. YJH-8 TaxID=3228714 RepID=UPI0038C17BA2